VDVKWQVTDGAEEQRAMAIAVRKEEIDSHVAQMKQAGIGPTSTFARAASLAAVAGRPDAMVAYVGGAADGSRPGPRRRAPTSP
jgi:hypothetical protein